MVSCLFRKLGYALKKHILLVSTSGWVGGGGGGDGGGGGEKVKVQQIKRFLFLMWMASLTVVRLETVCHNFEITMDSNKLHLSENSGYIQIRDSAERIKLYRNP